MPTSRTSRSFLVLGACLLSFGLGYLSNQLAGAEEERQLPFAELTTFARVLSHIDSSYVDPVDNRELIYGAIKGMIRTLDSHSAFLTPEELHRMRTQTRGEYVGVGMEIGMRDGAMVIIAPFEGGPAYEAGILSGDQLLEVAGTSTSSLTVTEVVNMLRGEQGTPVDVRIRRHDTANPERSEVLTFSLVRDTIHIKAVDSVLLGPGVGLISVSAFQASVSDDITAAIDDLELESDGELAGLILDLRNNPGGLLNEAIALADIFLDAGVVASTQSRHSHDNDEYRSRDGATRYYGPLVVLVNGGTASASEIVGGALQDRGRAQLVGTATFGKGTVQSIYNLEDGSGLKLTVARYFTPNMRSIHEGGLLPDFVVTAGPVGPSDAAETHLPDPLLEDGRTRTRPIQPFSPISDRQLRSAWEVLLTEITSR